jgi:S-adenosylmethionine:tRNA ribosyltransferase-isomerase
MKTADFDFHLPEDRIALRPAEPRDSARLLVVQEGVLDDRVIRDLPEFLRAGDALVFNDTRVIPARLSGVRERPNPEIAGELLTVEVEATLHHRDAADVWSAFMKPGKRIKAGDVIRFSAPFPVADGGRAGVGDEGAGRGDTLDETTAVVSGASIPTSGAVTPIPTLPPSRGKGFFVRGVHV